MFAEGFVVKTKTFPFPNTIFGLAFENQHSILPRLTQSTVIFKLLASLWESKTHHFLSV